MTLLRSSTGPEICYHIGLALLKLGKKKEAIEEFTAALESNARFADSAKVKALLDELLAGT